MILTGHFLHHSIFNDDKIFIPVFFQIRDGKWHKTIFEIRTEEKHRLPIINVKPFDTGLKKEYKIEAGDVCFVW